MVVIPLFYVGYLLLLYNSITLLPLVSYCNSSIPFFDMTIGVSLLSEVFMGLAHTKSIEYGFTFCKLTMLMYVEYRLPVHTLLNLELND